MSRFNSTSTSSTLVDTDHSLVSSVISPVALIDRKLSASSPIVQTADNKQWIDLDSISPKLLRELRRQYATSPGDEKNSIAKKASKIKAWTRQTKLGLDIRLRRKGQDHDEITDVRLIRDPVVGTDDFAWTVPELPEVAVCELPDTSIVPELPLVSESQQYENLESSRTDEPLPRYVPRLEGSSASSRPKLSIEPAELDGDDRGHSRSPSESSIVTTPTDGLNIEGFLQSVRQNPPDPRTNKSDRNESTHLSKATLDQAKQDMREEVVTLLNSWREELRKNACSGPNNGGDLESLRIAGISHYEPEIDEDLTSASEHRGTDTSPQPAHHSLRMAKHGNLGTGEVTLTRQPTIPRKVPVDDGAEGVWKVVLSAQRKILGTEHPLTLLAEKHAQSLSQVGHRKCLPEFLDALHESKRMAMKTLGDVHPLVETFCANLKTLESLLVDPDHADEAHSPEQDIMATRDMSHQDVTEQKVQESLEQREPLRIDTTPVDSNDKAHKTLPRIKLSSPSPEHKSLVEDCSELPHQIDSLWDSRLMPHRKKQGINFLASLVFSAATSSLKQTISWLENRYGPEPSVEPGKVRVRWTCSCGQELYDDFVEKRLGAARELEAYLNRLSQPRTRGDTSASPSSAAGGRSFGGSLDSSTGGSLSSQTSWSSYSQTSQRSFSRDDKRTDTISSLPQYSPFTPLTEPPWLLTCATEDRFATKMSHLDMSSHKITSDKDFAKALREHYSDVNRKWWKRLRLRELTTIQFVQFECHQNRFADIRKCPDMPPPNRDDYMFEPGELIPPVGSKYLLHLFKHPEDYEGELITYLRAPKKNGKLQLGVGWGINLVEGFLADRVWLLINAVFAFASVVFGVAWALEKNDIQGAFGVAQWICMFAVFAGGWAQACIG